MLQHAPERVKDTKNWREQPLWYRSQTLQHLRFLTGSVTSMANIQSTAWAVTRAAVLTRSLSTQSRCMLLCPRRAASPLPAVVVAMSTRMTYIEHTVQAPEKIWQWKVCYAIPKRFLHMCEPDHFHRVFKAFVVHLNAELYRDGISWEYLTERGKKMVQKW